MSSKVGFIGLGNVGGKLSGSLLRNGIDLTVRDLNQSLAQPFLEQYAKWADSPREMAEQVDVLITCLLSPAASAAVLEDPETGAQAVDCPVSGGCHRADTGNIAIFAGCERRTFEQMLPLLTVMGRRILHTGELGSASVLKVVTNYLASANLASIAEALVTSKVAGTDLNTTYEAIRISSGNSSVHETESQVILNGSRDISFTMDRVSKDVDLFADVAKRHGLELELAPLLVDVFADGEKRIGSRELSPNIIKRHEEAAGVQCLAPGFPPEITDDEPEEAGYEVVPNGRN